MAAFRIGQDLSVWGLTILGVEGYKRLKSKIKGKK
jgi:hypothetical protein